MKPIAHARFSRMESRASSSQKTAPGKYSEASNTRVSFICNVACQGYALTMTSRNGGRRHLTPTKEFCSTTVLDDAVAVYQTASERDDIEVYDEFDHALKLPDSGMQVHAEYTLYAHFFVLKRLLSGAQGITFYLDQDSGIRAACFTAFAEEIKQDFVHAFFDK